MGRSLQVAVLCLATSGCAGIAKDVAREAAPAAVEGGVQAVADPKKQEQLVRSIDPKTVEDGTQRLTSGGFDGLWSALSEPERKAQLLSAMEAFRLNLAIKEISSNGIPEVVHVAAESVRKELAGTTMDRGAVGSFTRELSKQATLGFQDALDEVKKAREAGAKKEGEGSVLWAAGKAAESGGGILWALGLGAVALLIALAVVLAVLLSSRRRGRAELDERDAALLLLAQAIKDTESEPWSNELRETLKETMRDQEGSEYLRRILREHRELRLRPEDRTHPIGEPVTST